MRLALWQGASPGGDVSRAFAEIERGLAVAAAAGAEMAVFPELMLPGYNSDRIADLAQAADGPWVARLRDMAQSAGCGVCVGYAERGGAVTYNSALVIRADGAVLATYRKIQLYGPREKALFAPGSDYAVFDLNGRRAAMLICYDVEFAGHVAALAARGVEVILVPTANMEPFGHVCRVTVPAQAVMHGVSVVYANYCGVEGDLTYCGASVILRGDGAVLAQAGPEPAILIADLGQADARLMSTQGADWRPV
jgi:5-aminopentanamidase